jgi:hypothetical protein
MILPRNHELQCSVKKEAMSQYCRRTFVQVPESGRWGRTKITKSYFWLLFSTSDHSESNLEASCGIRLGVPEGRQ